MFKVLARRIGVILCLFGTAPMLFQSKLVWGSEINSTHGDSDDNAKMLFDFTKLSTVDDWVEQSDVVRQVGMSKAVLTLQKTQIFQRAIFFTLLNPQPNGAGFAGVRTWTSLNLENFTKFAMKVRGQGNNSGYKVVLRHKGLDEEPHPTYEQMFQAPMDTFEVVELPLSEFKPYYRGRELNGSEAIPLDVTNITNFGLQVYGGVYLPVKQAGVSSLEIDWIKATKQSLDDTNKQT